MTTNVLPQFTDEVLTADLTSAAPGPRRRAEQLLKVPAEARRDIDAEADALRTLYPGSRTTDTVGRVVNEYLATGTIPTRYRDQANLHRQQEQARRDAAHRDRYTDERLISDLGNIDTSPGPGRSAKHLLTVPLEVRTDIAAEAQTMMNMAPGWRPSDTVRHIVAEYHATGKVSTHYRDMADEDRRRDRARRDAELAAAAAAFKRMR
jgi:hypothetical protein